VLHSPLGEMMARRRRPLLVTMGLAAALAACGWTKSEFARTAEEAGSAFAAAAATLRLEHEGRLTVPYLRSAFEVYRSQLDGLDAFPELERPCADGGCDWAAQMTLLAEAGEDFAAAAE
jgi:hypothetical protein